jgi:hypothetical protein
MAEPRDQYPIRAVLDHLRSVGLFDNDEVAISKFFFLPFRQFVDLGVFVAQEGSSAKHDTVPESLFYSASVSLSGGLIHVVKQSAA